VAGLGGFFVWWGASSLLFCTKNASSFCGSNTFVVGLASFFGLPLFQLILGQSLVYSLYPIACLFGHFVVKKYDYDFQLDDVCQYYIQYISSLNNSVYWLPKQVEAKRKHVLPPYHSYLHKHKLDQQKQMHGI